MLTEVEHKIFTLRSMWSGTRLGHLSLRVFVFSDYIFKRMKNTPASRWLQFSTSPTSVKYSVHICILHDYGKQGIKKTDVYRYSCHPLPFFHLFLHCSHADIKGFLLGPLFFHFCFTRVTFFLVWIIPGSQVSNFWILKFLNSIRLNVAM